MGRLGHTFLLAGVWLGLGLLIYLFFLRQEAPPVQLVGAEQIQLTRARDGHFHIDGAIQGEPVRFLIDTGASTVSISGALAERLGLGCDVASNFHTANGVVAGCTTRVRELDFGPFRLSDLSVAVLPNLSSPALLGMNARRRGRMEQAGDTLHLSPLK